MEIRGIDAGTLFFDKTNAYTNLKSLLYKLPDVNRENRYLLFSPMDFSFPLTNPLFKKIIPHIYFNKPGFLWRHLIIPVLIKKHNISIFWGKDDFPSLEKDLLDILRYNGLGFSKFHMYIKKQLDSISPSFCAAKWLQTTLHLHTGFTHSCHHPRAHKIPLDELKTDISALHNTSFKIKQRKLMLEGKRPAECQYCWNVENSNLEHFSDRIIKSGDPWARSFIANFNQYKLDTFFDPVYLEVNFGYECNMSCAYCLPDISSQIWSEFEKFGPYPTSSPLNDLKYLEQIGRTPYRQNKTNPYMKAFWKWFPDIAENLKVFRITGGEPLINQNTFKLLDYIDNHPLPFLELSINSNMCVPDSNFHKFIYKINKLLQGKKIQDFTFFASVDTYGKQAEYIRHGLDFNKFLRNASLYLEELPSKLTFMVTFNLLSIPMFTRLLKFILSLKEKYPVLNRNITRVLVDISLLQSPEYLSVNISNTSLKESIHESHSFMIENSKENVSGGNGFIDYEIDKLARIISCIKSIDPVSEEVKRSRNDFRIFIDEYDRRKHRDFLSTFPEFNDFYQECKELNALR